MQLPAVRANEKCAAAYRYAYMSTDRATINNVLEEATARLATGTARLDAEVLLACALQQPRSHLYAWPEQVVTSAVLNTFTGLLQRRAAGEPVAYLTGAREFWSLPLTVTTATLIPRPETETLVELALEKLPVNSPLQVADLGTGSGAIALALASERPACRIVATDISSQAVHVADANAARLGLANIEFVTGDWCAPLPATRFDMIVSNPPYVIETDPHLVAGDVRFEPRAALAAGPEGMDALTHIARSSAEYLRRDGWLLVEHGYDQGEQTVDLFHACGFRHVSDHTDGAGASRVTMGMK